MQVAFIARLPSLACLELVSLEDEAVGALAACLTALTGLTRFACEHAGATFGDAQLLALTPSWPQLQCLSIRCGAVISRRRPPRTHSGVLCGLNQSSL